MLNSSLIYRPETSPRSLSRFHPRSKQTKPIFEVYSSPLFQARPKHIGDIVGSMKKAITAGDTSTIGMFAEEDTLNLHAITMMGKSHLVLWEPDTVRILKEVVKMRREVIPVWYSMDIDPSVFINLTKSHAEEVMENLPVKMNMSKTIVSEVGDKPSLTHEYLF